MLNCPNCGEENPDRFRLCGFCGAPLAAAAPPQELRKVVTVLFCDLKGSTSLGESLDPESLREVMSRYFEVMSAAIARHGGTIEKYIGDAVMAVFGLPRVHEDDALRAVRAAQAMQDGLRELNTELEQAYGVTLANRIGVNTGEVVAGDATTGQRLVTGDAVNVAARLEQAAGDTETLLGELTYRLVRGVVDVDELEPLALKGKAASVPAFKLVGIRDAFANDPLGTRQTLVGRGDDVATLLAALDGVVATRTTAGMLVLGEAGVGKTRLLDEFAAAVDGSALVLRGRCLSYGDGITFWPLVEAIRSAAGVANGDQAATVVRKLETFVGSGHGEVTTRIASLLGLADTSYPLSELRWALRRLLEILSSRQPVVLVIEDLHWAEPTLQELLESLGSGGRDAAALIVSTARPDVLEKYPRLAEQRTLTLARLSAADTIALVEELLDGPVEPTGLARVIDAADGNPLFAQQLVSMLRENGQLELTDGVWRLAELPADWVPPTIHALLSARIDALDRENRAVIEPAAVIGHQFPIDAVEELTDDFVKGEVRPRVDWLTSNWYLDMPTDWAPAEFRQFHHIFIRDSVYESLLKRQRATLHERFVAWADEVNGDRAVEFEEILGYHLEQAHRYLSELAPADDHVRGLGAESSRRLAAAGRRAFVRGDGPAAATLLRRAAQLLPAGDRDRLALMPDLAEALMQVGELAAADIVVDEAVAEAARTGEPALAGGAMVVRQLIGFRSGITPGWSEAARTTGRAAIDAAMLIGDDATLARAYRLLAWIDGKALHYGAAAESLGHAILHASRGGDLRQERRAASAYALTSTYGPTPVDEALARCAEVAERVSGDRQTEAFVQCLAAHLHALRGEFDRSRTLCATARAMFEELGARMDAASMVLESSRVELLAGRPDAADAELERGFRELEELRERFVLSTLSGLRARALWELGRVDQAEDLTTLAEELAEPDDIDAQVHWRCVRAKVHAWRGAADEAEALVQGAIALVEETDAVIHQIEAQLDLAEVRTLSGRSGADEALARAHTLAVAKGSDVLAARALAGARAAV